MIEFFKLPRLFILLRRSTPYSDNDHFTGEIASRNMWNNEAQLNVCEVIPLKNHLFECDNAYKMGLQQGKLAAYGELGAIVSHQRTDR